MYTVLPPPTDYTTDSEKSVTLAQLESINSAEDPAGKTTIINIYVLPMCTIKLGEIYGGVFLQGKALSIIKVTLLDCLCLTTSSGKQIVISVVCLN